MKMIVQEQVFLLCW